jgi:two-component system, LuxR family, response regulator FixJ
VSELNNSQKSTVIVVDDDVFICRALKTQLEILGFNVTIFQSAEDLLAGGLPTSDSCLLCDVYLPGMSGTELCLHLAKNGSHLRMILMTGRDDQQTRRLMREAKPVAKLFKPFDQDALLRAIHRGERRPKPHQNS